MWAFNVNKGNHLRNIAKKLTSEGSPDNLTAALVASAYFPSSTSFLTSDSVFGASGFV